MISSVIDRVCSCAVTAHKKLNNVNYVVYCDQINVKIRVMNLGVQFNVIEYVFV